MSDSPSADGQQVRDCRNHVMAALVQAMAARPRYDWIEQEPTAVAVAANQWAEAHGIGRRVTVDDIERIEGNAVGHVDYASKLALYVAEFIIDPADWMMPRG